jgi:cysteine dioxygenase
MNLQLQPSVIAIEDFASELRRFPASAFEGMQEILNFLACTRVRPETLTPYLHYDRQHYTRNLIDRTSVYELMAICWEIGQASSAHNHRDQNCWMAVPIGRLVVQNYRTVFQDIKKGKCQLETAERVEMNADHPCAVDPHEPVHRVINPPEFGQRAVSLHVYSRPFDTCVVYSPEHGTCGEIELHFNTEYGQPRQVGR